MDKQEKNNQIDNWNNSHFLKLKWRKRKDMEKNLKKETKWHICQTFHKWISTGQKEVEKLCLARTTYMHTTF